MPKRDSGYMTRQRERIAQAALDVLLEKGVSETSLRDICKAAGISIGALYTHFATKEELIVAACMIDHEEMRDRPLPEDWPAYLKMIRNEAGEEMEARSRKRVRVSLQFVAEISQMDRNPEGLSGIYLLYRGWIRGCLQELMRGEVIDLPFGLERTIEMHMQLIAGAVYQLASDRDLNPDHVMEALQCALAVTAGFRGQEAERMSARAEALPS